MRVITVINQKGGVGKSTTTYGLGGALSLKGYKVLYIDLDPQANLSFTLGAQETGSSSASVLMEGQSLSDAIQSTAIGSVVPSAPENASAERRLTKTGSEYRLKEALAEKALDFDFVLIDTPPALGVLTVNALTASDGIVVPVLADGYSLQGLAQLQDTLEVVRKYCNPALKVYGLALSRFTSRASFSREAKAELEKKAAELGTVLFDTVVRECVSVKESLALSLNLFDYAPRSTAADDFKSLAEELITKMEKE